MALLFLAFPLASVRAQTQVPRGAIHGRVTDPEGGLIPHASATLTLAGTTNARTTTANDSGEFNFRNLAPSRYTLSIAMENFEPSQNRPITIGGTTVEITIQLKIAAVTQSVVVTDTDVFTIDPATNASANTLSSVQLEVLPDDSGDLLTQLEALAGSNSAHLTVDGFDATRLPPKSSILQVRINSDPYSAENDTSPQSGNIQVITKPGTDAIHGGIYAGGNTSALNAKNPFNPQQPPYNSDYGDFSLTGPITKNSSYDMSGYENDQRTNAVISAATLDSSLNQTTFSQSVSNPNRFTQFQGRVRFQPTKNDITAITYFFSGGSATNSGVGQTTLASQGINTSRADNGIRFANTHLVGKNIANITRFVWDRSTNSQTPVSSAPGLVVQGAFSGGGNSGGQSQSTRYHYELQNYLMITAGKHYLEVGARVRSDLLSTTSNATFNGTYFFASLSAYQLTLQGQEAGLTPAQIRANGGGASQFTIAAGTPTTQASMTDAGIFLQDDWKARANLTISGGLRFETQTGTHDHGDWAPRLGFSWAIDKKKKWILRAGSGVFYQRFSADTIFNVRRQNGTRVVTYTATNPDYYPAIPSLASLAAQSSSVIYQTAPDLRSPYQLSYEAELDRSLGKHGSIAFTVREVRGVHNIYTRNANAPLPGTYNAAVPTSGTRPFGCCQAIDQYTSEGASRRTQLNANFNFNFGKAGSMYGAYTLSWRKSNTSGGFPSDQYSLAADYGRDSNDSRLFFYTGYNVPLPYKFHLSGTVVLYSPTPFNIVLGQDLNGDLQFNDRPSFATDLSRPSVVKTKYGNFDTAPIAGQTIIPINYGQGSSTIYSYLSFGRSFPFNAPKKPVVPPGAAATAPSKPAPAAPGTPAAPAVPAIKPPVHLYVLDLSINAQNPLNHPTYANPVGTLGSPLFGQSLSLLRHPLLPAQRKLPLLALLQCIPSAN